MKVIDGGGGSAVSDQTVIIDHGRIRKIGSASQIDPPIGAMVLELFGYAVIPGFVGLHERLAYLLMSRHAPPDHPILLQVELAFSAPRLLLANGVTSLRTAGTIEPYTELSLNQLIDEGKIPGPKLHITGPRLSNQGDFRPQLHRLSGPEDARRTVNYWADEGATSFKAYQQITRAELAAVIAAAH